MDATTVGVDLAKNIFVACVADCAGRIVERREFNRAGFLSWLGTLPAGTVIGMEACGSAHHWGRTAQRLGLAPRLMAAEFVRPYRKRQSVKNDRADAEAILIALRSPGMRFVPVKTEAQQQRLAWHTLRVGWVEERTALLNRDATWTKKHGKSHFGYKLSINVDTKYKIIRKIETDTASTHDSQHFDNVFDTVNTSRDVYADRGYPSAEREAWLKENGFRNQIQRKGQRNKPLSECQQRRNTRIAKTRARVEHVFGAIEQMGGKLLRTVGQARANFAMTMMAACYNLKRLVYFRKAGIKAF